MIPTRRPGESKAGTPGLSPAGNRTCLLREERFLLFVSCLQAACREGRLVSLYPPVWQAQSNHGKAGEKPAREEKLDRGDIGNGVNLEQPGSFFVGAGVTLRISLTSVCWTNHRLGFRLNAHLQKQNNPFLAGIYVEVIRERPCWSSCCISTTLPQVGIIVPKRGSHHCHFH